MLAGRTIGDISNPDLINTCHVQAFEQVRVYGIIAVRGFDEPLGLLCKKALFPHDPLDFLAVYHNAVPAELSRSFSVAVRGKVLGELFDPGNNGLVLKRYRPGFSACSNNWYEGGS
ncbi:MAG TPA: hypothetical protein VL122_06105 [Nitrospirota bacterium]|nr:hypothetical protein [Nitrospirota bacterium]